MNLDLSIIIVNYRERGFLRQSLKGIRRANLRLRYEVIVIDNASTDGSAEMVREHFPEVRLIALRENRGFAKGNNIGIKTANGRYLLFLNADIALFSNVLERLVNFLDQHLDVGVVAPKLMNPDGSMQVSCYRFPSMIVPILRRTPFGRLPAARRILRRYLMLDFDHQSIQPVEWALCACLMVRRKAIDEVGVMDERFFMYFEDVDWCRRFWNAGWKVMYVADVSLIHYHQRMSAESPGLNGVFQKLTRIHIMSGMKYFRKYFRQPPPRNVSLDNASR